MDKRPAVRIDGLAELTDIYVHHVRAPLIFIAPDMFFDSGTGEDRSLIAQQIFQDSKFAPREEKLPARTEYAVRGWIKGKIGKRERCLPALFSAHQYTHARKKLFGCERLDQIIVRACVKPAYPVFNASLCGQQEHRDCLAGGAYPAQNLDRKSVV